MKHKYKILKTIPSRNKFPQSPKTLKNTIPNTMAIERSIVSFPDHEH